VNVRNAARPVQSVARAQPHSDNAASITSSAASFSWQPMTSWRRLYQHLFDTTSDFKMSRRAELGISTCVNSGSSSTSGDIDVSAIVNGSSNSSDADGLFKADESFPAGSETAASQRRLQEKRRPKEIQHRPIP
jgi:hypothetical protein